jgi:hypothetical protein
MDVENATIVRASHPKTSTLEEYHIFSDLTTKNLEYHAAIALKQRQRFLSKIHVSL